MKKILLCVLVLFATLFIFIPKLQAEVTLSSIVDKFKEGELYKTYQNDEYHVNFTITNTENSIDVVMSAREGYSLPGAEGSIKFDLTNTNMLSSTIRSDSEDYLFEALVTTELIRVIGVVNGISDDDVIATINDENFLKTLELSKDNLEMKDTTEGDVTIVNFKVLMDKKFTVIDTSNLYIQPGDMGDHNFKTYGSLQLTRGYVTGYMVGDSTDEDFTITFSQSRGFDVRTRKSLDSFLTAIFDDTKVNDYVTSKYPNVTMSDLTVDGFKVEYNPTKEGLEDVVFGEDNILRVTIYPEALKTAAYSVTNNQNTNNNQNNNEQPITNTTTSTPSSNPKTGVEDYASIIFVTLLACATGFYYLSKKQVTQEL